MSSFHFCNIFSKTLCRINSTISVFTVPCVTKPVNSCYLVSSVLDRKFSSWDFVQNRNPLRSRKLLTNKPFYHSVQMGNYKVSNSFSLNDYDCIGFDLDNTLCEYKIRPMVEMEYDMLSRFLVEKRGYDYKILYQPLSEVDIDFLQKGLILDFEKGNVLKISETGVILSACHGTSQMSEKDVIEQYGKEKKWSLTTQYSQDFLSVWNGPVTTQLRTLLDYFDMPASLLFARGVDSIDSKVGRSSTGKYAVGRDVLDSLINLYNRDHFSSGQSGYFKELKSFPEGYIKKCSPRVINWIKQIKSMKPVILITGSNVDYASFTASYCLGEDWRQLFDVIVCYAKKPGFFTDHRPFLRIHGFKEGEELQSKDLDFGNIYSQGNWKDLYSLLIDKTGKQEPKCLYIGDNIVQDIYTPSKLKICDTLAVSEELGGECITSVDVLPHQYESVIKSRRWGSYFKDSKSSSNTLWGSCIRKHAKACVSSLKVIASMPFDSEIKGFSDQEFEEGSGYYPSCPSCIKTV